MIDPATLTIASVPAHVGVCELCAVGPETLRTSVLVGHATGAGVQLVACERCTAAVRRIIAVARGATPTGPAQVVVGAPERDVPAGQAAEGMPPDLVGAPALVHQFMNPVRGLDGAMYAVHVYGQGRADGTWIGWLSFVSPAGKVVRRTGRETTQSSQDQVAYWATGLQPSYLEGAFHRASLV
jgi:hypothetical protein